MPDWCQMSPLQFIKGITGLTSTSESLDVGSLGKTNITLIFVRQSCSDIIILYKPNKHKSSDSKQQNSNQKMIIHQLKMINFKSYLGEHIIGPFHPHFNCVIGPNGNGKSNIIDAVLFVFGFKSTKLRQDSLASLIHRSAFGQPDKATVSVVFNDQGTLIEVSRTVTRNGAITYKLNNERINWIDLRATLVSKKIDLNKNLFIILQGQVERLCELSPQKMVEYLQYVSGSDQLKESISEAEKQYIEKSIKREELKMSSNVKKKIFDKFDEKVRNKTVQLLIKLRIDAFDHLILKKRILQSRDRIRQMKQGEKQLKSVIEEVQDEIKAIEQELDRKNIDLKPINQKINANNQKISSLEKQFEKQTMKMQEIQRQITFLANDKQKKNQQKKRYIKEKEDMNYIYGQQQEVLEHYHQLKRSLSTLKQLDVLKNCLQWEQKITQLKQDMQKMIEKTKENQMNLAVGRQKIAIFQQKQKEFKTLKEKYNLDLKEIGKEKKQILPKIKQTEQTIEHLERQIKMKNNQSKTALSHQQKVINQIRNANRLKIICPQLTLHTLRQLVVINPSYRQVIETILPQLDYFVVNTSEQAKTIADYLRAKQIGRMTFLIKQFILVSIKGVELTARAPSQTKLIIDLIKCTDNDARNILIWALRDTLVTDELETAMKVAYEDPRHFRVITTKGEFIDSSGTITKLALKSIGREDHQFAMKKLQTLQRLKITLDSKFSQLEANERDINSALQSIMNEQRSFDGLDEVILAQLQKQINKDNQKIGKYSEQLKQVEISMESLKKQLIKKGFNMKHYSSILEQLRQFQENQEKIRKIQNCQSIVNSLDAKISKIEKESQALASKMEQKMKAKIVLQTEKAKITKQIDAFRDQIAVINVDKDYLMNQITALQRNRIQRLNKLNGDKTNSGNDRFKEDLHRLRIAIRNAQFERLDFMNKLETSMKAFKDLCGDLFKNIFTKYPELFPTIQGFQIMNDDMVDAMLKSQPPLQITKTREFSIIDIFSTVQFEFLMGTSRKKGSLYNVEEDILPEPTLVHLLLESTTEKQLKFNYVYEQQKLKQHQKDQNNSFDNSFINTEIFDQYKQHRDEYKSLLSNLKQAEDVLNLIRDRLIQLRRKRLDIFMSHFNDINVELNRIYTKLTGGRAELNFLDSMNPFEGVQFSVRPVNKSWKRVNLLSGGEKTFTSLALIFACEQIKKFPFYFMDEIDAALDYRNTTLLANYIKEKTSTQHIVISLRKNMYQQCSRIVGIYKVKDQSHTIEYDMEELQIENDC